MTYWIHDIFYTFLDIDIVPMIVFSLSLSIYIEVQLVYIYVIFNSLLFLLCVLLYVNVLVHQCIILIRFIDLSKYIYIYIIWVLVLDTNNNFLLVVLQVAVGPKFFEKPESKSPRYGCLNSRSQEYHVYWMGLVTTFWFLWFAGAVISCCIVYLIVTFVVYPVIATLRVIHIYIYT